MIRDKQLYLAGTWNFDFISQQLPGKASISDVDGILERRGYLLLIEAKHPRCKQLSAGQRILMERSTASGQITGLIMWGENSQPQNYQLYVGGKAQPAKPATPEAIAEIIWTWYQWASSQPRPRLGNQKDPFTIS